MLVGWPAGPACMEAPAGPCPLCKAAAYIQPLHWLRLQRGLGLLPLGLSSCCRRLLGSDCQLARCLRKQCHVQRRWVWSHERQPGSPIDSCPLHVLFQRFASARQGRLRAHSAASGGLAVLDNLLRRHKMRLSMTQFSMIQCIILAALLMAATAQDVATVDSTVDSLQTEHYKPVPTEFTDSTASAAYNEYVYSEVTGYDYELPLEEVEEDPAAVKPASAAAVPDQASSELMHITAAEEPASQLHSTGIMWTMSAPAVLPEDSASSGTDNAPEVKPTDKPGSTSVSTSEGNPPGTIYYMAGGKAASSQASSSTGTVGSSAVALASSSGHGQVTATAVSSNGQVTTTSVSAPQFASNYESGSVMNLAGSSAAPVADDVAGKSDVSSGVLCGPASTYLASVPVLQHCLHLVMSGGHLHALHCDSRISIRVLVRTGNITVTGQT